MREELAKRDNLRGVFTATFAHYGKRTQYRGPDKLTLLFRDVQDEAGNVVTDHLWFTSCKQWEALRLVESIGERVRFEARVRPYWKGYHDDRRRDYRLSHPTKATVINRTTEGLDHANKPLTVGDDDQLDLFAHRPLPLLFEEKHFDAQP